MKRYSKLGGRIKYIRKIKDLNQVDVAISLGIPRSAISKIENGKQEMTSEILFQFAIKYDVSADFLLGISDEPTLPQKVIDRFNEKTKL
ncbi:MAG: helix-turn-helix domain-containing protein [Ruminiclostridium sp.]|nr:helix-turn-helix domain-containing protein [Ruminiclostridium sp.]